MKSNLPMASLALAIVFSAPVAAQDPNRQLIADLVVQIQELQDEVRSLRGQVEDMGYQIETLQQRQRDQYLDLDQRINDLRTATPAAGSDSQFGDSGTATSVIDAGVAAAAGGDATMSPAADVPEVRAPVESDTSVTGLAAPTVASVDRAPTPANEKDAYDAAFQSLKDLRYADAAEGFSDFLVAYPQSEYADNAQYWLGESYYVTGNYDIALESFNDLRSNYADSAKAPDALLKIGYTHYELQNWDQARAALEQVKAEYPNTTVARLADSRLRSMRLEGR